jgi:hypothetical protein
MKPKEKAKELVNTYVNLSKITASSEYIQYQAKQYALIAVDEILEECRLERDWYWEEVKKEIEKL